MLNDVDKPGSDVEGYTHALEGVLQQNMDMIKGLMGQVNRFKNMLGKEKKISDRFYEAQKAHEEFQDLDDMDVDYDEIEVHTQEV